LFGADETSSLGSDAENKKRRRPWAAWRCNDGT